MGSRSSNSRVIASSALLMLGAALLSALFAVGNTILAVRVGQNVGADLRSAIVRKVQTWSFGNLDEHPDRAVVGARDQRRDAGTDDSADELRILTRAPLWVIGSVIMLTWTSTKLALFMLALMPLIFGMIWIMIVQGPSACLARCSASWTA